MVFASDALAAEGRFKGLDALRGAAAVCIIAFHTVMLNSLGLPTWSTGLVHRLGLAVPLFYMLSAFSLSLGYYGKLDTAVALKRYALRRFLRIAPLFYALLPVWLCVLWFKFDQAPSLSAIALNLTFLFGFAPGLHESIAWAGWSIGVEMIFYAILPLIFLVATSLGASLGLYGFSLVASVIVQNLLGPSTSYAQMNFVTQLPHFMLGLVAFHAYRSGVLQRWKHSALTLLAGGIAIWPLMAWLGLGHLKVGAVDIEQYLIALAFPLITLSLVLAPRVLLVNPISIFLGQRSFSLYLLHPLVVLAAMPVIQDHAARGFKLVAPVSFLGVLLLTTIAASISYRLIETPFMALGRGKRGGKPAALPA